MRTGAAGHQRRPLTMDEATALKILNDCQGYVQTQDCGPGQLAKLDVYRGEVFLDGRFTVEQLRAILFLFEAQTPQLPQLPPTFSGPEVESIFLHHYNQHQERFKELAKMDDVLIDHSNKLVEPGVYKHYKRGRFVVLGVATNCKTEEKFVVFYNEDNLSSLWLRPLAEFLSPAELDGVEVARFVKVEAKFGPTA